MVEQLCTHLDGLVCGVLQLQQQLGCLKPELKGRAVILVALLVLVITLILLHVLCTICFSSSGVLAHGGWFLGYPEIQVYRNNQQHVQHMMLGWCCSPAWVQAGCQGLQ